ncbi:MAG: hypothetical protein OSJ58_15535 [Dysosmobacter sp.]|nr:hypothetical protein [Dysosmobacter sp.]
MQEFTIEQYKELESRVLAKVEKLYPEDTAGLVQTICKLAVPVAICTIREYEQMKREK